MEFIKASWKAWNTEVPLWGRVVIYVVVVAIVVYFGDAAMYPEVDS